MNKNVLTLFQSVISPDINADKVTHLCTSMSLASPKGYEVKLNYSSLFMVTVNDEHLYISCDSFTPCSTRTLNKLDMCATLSTARRQKSCGDNPSAPLTSLWLTVEELSRLDEQFDNCFTSYFIMPRFNFTFNNRLLLKDNVYLYNSSKQLPALDYSNIAFITPFNAHTSKPEKYTVL